MNLYESVNYKSDIKFLHSRFIREYDICKANISILFKYGVIDEKTYVRLYNSSRDVRQREVGLMEKFNPEVYKILAAGIIEAKKQLFLSNDVKEYEVLSIKNDAVFIIDRQLPVTEFDGITFAQKNTYTSYLVLPSNLEVLYGIDKVNKTEVIDVKGIKSELHLHQEYFLDFITFILSSIETESIDEVIKSFIDFYNDYINRSLPIEYYREFNVGSKYRIYNSMYLVNTLQDTDSNKCAIDISCNLDILRTIYKYLTETFFEVKRK